jgi:hypothetical protein
VVEVLGDEVGKSVVPEFATLIIGVTSSVERLIVLRSVEGRVPKLASFLQVIPVFLPLGFKVEEKLKFGNWIGIVFCFYFYVFCLKNCIV